MRRLSFGRRFSIFALVFGWGFCGATGLFARNLRDELQKFLAEFDKARGNVPSSTAFEFVAVDLADDGKQEIVMYLEDQNWCGSGGCLLLVLAPTESSFRVVSEVSITRRPIRVLRTKHHGWHDLGVWVQGGGILRGYEAALPFHGVAYAGNPTVPPAYRITGQVRGKVILSRQ